MRKTLTVDEVKEKMEKDNEWASWVKIFCKADFPYGSGRLHCINGEWIFGNQKGETFIANEEFVRESILGTLKHHRFDLDSLIN